MSVGEKWRFSFSETSDDSDEGNEFGFYEYEISEVNEVDGTKMYTIRSTLELQESNACKPTTASGTQTVNSNAASVTYEFDISVGSG